MYDLHSYITLYVGLVPNRVLDFISLVDDMVNKTCTSIQRHMLFLTVTYPSVTCVKPTVVLVLGRPSSFFSAVRQRKAAHKLLIRSPEDPQQRDHHRKLCAVAQKLDRKLKNQYFKERLEAAGTDSGKLRRIVNTVSSRTKSTPPPLVAAFGKVVSDPGRHPACFGSFGT